MSPRTPSPLSAVLALCVIAAAVIGGIVLLVAARPEPVTITINPPVATVTPAPLVVYVTGAVNQPETMVTLPHGSRTADAVAAAGGAASNADIARMDMAALLRDGDTVHILALGEIPEAQPNAVSGDQPVVHINRATLAELETLPGIGPAIGQRIIDYRTANGDFTSLEALMEVSGIGERTLEALDGLVAFD
jgi:competence protein ComEA